MECNYIKQIHYSGCLYVERKILIKEVKENLKFI